MGGKSIVEVTAMTATEWNKVGDKAAALLEKREPLISDWKEPHFFGQWFAAAALAYHRNPQEYARQLAEYRLMQKLPKAITGTTRDATQFVEPERQLTERIDKQATGSILERHFVDLLAPGAD
jgi:hypothetical protein